MTDWPKEIHCAIRALVVDDESELREFVSAVLMRAGFDVTVAGSGFEALEKARKRGCKLDLLISDIEMPGMTGVELARHIKIDRPEVKILLISGITPGFLVHDGGWNFLQKPFVPTKLMEKVYSVLRDPSQYVPDLSVG